MSQNETFARALAAALPPDDIQQALIDWIGECPYIHSTEQILTDLLDAGAPPGYAIAATGSAISQRYLRAANEWTNTYALYARFLGKENPQRQRNARFVQDFAQWVEIRAKKRQFFAIDKGEVRSISVSNGMLFEADESGNAIYQIQLRLIYYREV